MPKSISAQIGVSEKGHLRMTFSKAALSPKQIRDCFNRKFFSVIEPYEMPEPLARQLGLSSGKDYISIGKYPIKETSEMFIIDF
ncbi:MAG: hypothetical protein WCR52_00280 [Bacteroidota bacterium]